MAVYTKKWNGSAWVTAPFKKWTGSAWVDAYVWKWTGSSWFQLYPEPLVYVTEKSVRTSGLYACLPGYDWESGYAAQGSGSGHLGSGYFGFMGISCTSFPGSGSVAATTYKVFSGRRGSLGEFFAIDDQIITFYHSPLVNGNYPDSNRLYNDFYAYTGGPGVNGWMERKALSGYGFEDWLNGAFGQWLWIHDETTSQLLSLTDAYIIASYSYTAAAAMFADTGEPVAYNLRERDYKMEGGSEVFHKMPIYQDEVGMTLWEIMDRREQGIVEDIDPTTVDYMPGEILPWLRKREVFVENEKTKVKVEAMNMRMQDEVQYSLDNVEWDTLYGNVNDNYVEAELPPDFDKYADNVYIRILDKQRDEIIRETVIKPIIYIDKN